MDIRWDMMNETDGSYSANVTIANYVMDHHLEQSWRLAYIWVQIKGITTEHFGV